MSKDYYDQLQVDRNASAEEIKKAYKQLAKKYHPDANNNDQVAEQKFKEINEAYQVLGDEQKRSMYDRFGEEGVNGMSGSSGGFGGGFSGFGDIFSSIFEDFGFGGQNSRGQQDSDKYDLNTIIEQSITFKESVIGISKKEIKFKYKSPCGSCNGTGAKDGKTTNCGYCNGSGEVLMRHGPITLSQTCPKCGGTGKMVKDKCNDCNGSTYQVNEDSLTIDVPKGIDNGNKIRVSGRGNKSKHGNRGDLYIVFNVEKDKYFVRDSSDIYIKVPIFFTQVLLGDTIEIPSLNGKLKLEIKTGVRDNEQIVFRGEGITKVNTSRKGNLIAQIEIRYPKSLNSEQKELVKNLSDSFGVDATPQKSDFENIFDKIKEWFK